MTRGSFFKEQKLSFLERTDQIKISYKMHEVLLNSPAFLICLVASTIVLKLESQLVNFVCSKSTEMHPNI